MPRSLAARLCALALPGLLAACGAAPAPAGDAVGTVEAQTVAALPTATAAPPEAPSVAPAATSAAGAPVDIAITADSAPLSGRVADGSPARYRLALPSGSVASFALKLDGDGTVLLTRDEEQVFGYTFYGGAQTIDERLALTNDDAGPYVLELSGNSTYSFTVTAVPQADGGATGDAGNRPEEARPLALGDTRYAGQLGNRDDVDYYRFTAPAGSSISLDISFDDRQIDGGDVEILSGADVFIGAPILLDSKGWKASWLLSSDLADQEYVLRVRKAASYSFQIRSAPQNDAGVAGDAGDSAATARVITVGETRYAGQLGDLDEFDFYRVTAQPGSLIDFEVRFDDRKVDGGDVEILADGDVFLGAPILLDANSWQIAWALSGDVPARDYLIKVAKARSYSLRITSAPQSDAGAAGDAGDSEATARPIGFGQPVEGRLGRHDLKDYYLLTLEQPTQLVIQSRVPDQQRGAFGVALWQDGQRLGGIGASEGNAATLRADEPLPAGTYFLVIEGDGTYSVEMSAE